MTIRRRFAIAFTCAFAAILPACGRESSETARTSRPNAFLIGHGWALAHSPYTMLPGQSIAVCDTGVKAGVESLVIEAVRTWLAEGGRDERLVVRAGCDGDRILKLVPVSNAVSYYGQTSPLRGKTNRIDVPPRWASFWTANHEVGHVFGFAHDFNEISIMNSEDNGIHMNGGHISAFDRSEIRRMLATPAFGAANAAWAL